MSQGRLTSSSRARSSAASLRSALARLSRNCASVRPPMTIEVIVADRRLGPAGELARALRRLLVAPVLAGQEAARKRAPDQHPEFLVAGDRQKLVFGGPRFERVVDLLRDEGDETLPPGDLHRLHHMPAGEIRAADVAHLARTDEVVQRLQRLLERGEPIPLMELEIG